MKRLRFALFAITVLLVNAYAQVTDPVSWTVNLYSAASQAPAGTVVYRLATDVVCGVDQAGRAVGTVINPHEIRWTDWRNSTKDCLAGFSTALLADGDYYAEIIATDLAGNSSKPPTRSNTFTVQTATPAPPPTPQPPPTPVPTSGPAPVVSPLIR